LLEELDDILYVASKIYFRTYKICRDYNRVGNIKSKDGKPPITILIILPLIIKLTELPNLRLHHLPQLDHLPQKLIPHLLLRRNIRQLFQINLILHEQAQDQMLINFDLLVFGGLGQGGAGRDERLAPPVHLLC
jgi:hypothetical protein